MADRDDGSDRRGSKSDRRAQSRTRLVLASANRLYRRGLVHALGSEPDCEVVAETDDVATTVMSALEIVPDIAVVDLGLPDPGGLEATRRIRHADRSIGVVVIGFVEDDSEMFEAVRAGAGAYVPAGVRPDELAHVIRRVARREYLINDQVASDPLVASRVLAEFRGLDVYPSATHGSPFAPLSLREGEILGAIAGGRSNKEVAQFLSISEQTVKNHMSSILRKLSLNDRTQAVVHAIRQGWISITPGTDVDRNPGSTPGS